MISPELFKTLLSDLAEEENESLATLHLTANETAMSSFASACLTSPLYGRYHLGDANKRETARYQAAFSGLGYKSLPAVHELERQAALAAARLFGARYVDCRPLSGVHALIATVAGLTSPNDRVYCLAPSEGGHFATSSIIARLGRKCTHLPWDNAAADFDIEKLRQVFDHSAPRLIYVDHSTCLYAASLKRLRGEAPDATIVYDASHPLGLIAGHSFANPLTEGCDVLQGNTHKSFPGSQKGIIMTNSSLLAERIGNTLDTFVSSQHSGDTLALYVTMLEMDAFGRDYARQTIANAKRLATDLSGHGFDVFERGHNPTDSHQFLMQGFTEGAHMSAANALLKCGISANAKTTLGRPVIRFGVQEVTRRGLRENDMATIAQFIFRALRGRENPQAVRRDVAEFARGHRSGVSFSFDNAPVPLELLALERSNPSQSVQLIPSSHHDCR